MAEVKATLIKRSWYDPGYGGVGDGRKVTNTLFGFTNSDKAETALLTLKSLSESGVTYSTEEVKIFID